MRKIMKLKYEKNYDNGSYKAVVLKLARGELVVNIEPSLVGGEKFYTAFMSIDINDSWNSYQAESDFATGYSLQSIKNEIDERFRDIIFDYVVNELEEYQSDLYKDLGLTREVV